MKQLEKTIPEQIQPKVDEAIKKWVGVRIEDISKDITEKLKKSPLWDFRISTAERFKKEKQRFKHYYLKKLLSFNLGNISDTARIADVDRRTVHRLSRKEDVQKIRMDIPKKEYARLSDAESMLSSVFREYEEVLHPKKMELIYKNISDISKDILKELPEEQLTLKEAELVFEKEYLQQALAENNNDVVKTAKRIGLRYETLHRKLKRLGMI